MKVCFNFGMREDKPIDAEAVRVIDLLDGPTEVANMFPGDITAQAVSQWKRKGIPKPWRLVLRLMRPDVFERSAEQLSTGE